MLYTRCRVDASGQSGLSGCLLARLPDAGGASAPVRKKFNQLSHCADVQSWPLLSGMRAFLNAARADTKRRGGGPKSPQVVTTTADNGGFDLGPEGKVAPWHGACCSGGGAVMLYQTGDHVSPSDLPRRFLCRVEQAESFKVRDGIAQILKLGPLEGPWPAGTRLIRLDGAVIPAPTRELWRRHGRVRPSAVERPRMRPCVVGSRTAA